MSTKLRIPSASDQAVVRAFQEAGGLFPLKPITRILAQTLGEAEIEIAPSGTNQSESEQLFWSGAPSYACTRIRFQHLESIELDFVRNPEPNPSPYFSEIRFAKGSLSAEVVLKVNKILEPLVVGVDLANPVHKMLGETASEFLGHRETIGRLETLAARLVGLNQERYEAVETRLREKYEGLEEQLQARHEVKLGELTTEEKRLADLKVELDLKDNTAARRERIKNLIQELKRRQEKFELTSGTQEKREPVRRFAIALICLLLGIGLSLGAFLLISKREFGEFHLIVVSLLASAGAASAWYLRWADRWFAQHAEAEFRTKQFELDIERAGWIVEVAMDWEMSTTTHNMMPETLMDRFSGSLFSNATTETNESPITAAEQLAAVLMRGSSGVKVKSENFEADFGKKELKDLGKNT